MPNAILVVDDDDDLREALADVLRDTGYRVRVATDGQEAMAEMRARLPCVVVLDLMMPVMDGWEVVDAMKRDPLLAAIPICVISAVSSKAPPSCGVVLPKPVAVSALLAAVREHCDMRCTAGVVADA